MATDFPVWLRYYKSLHRSITSYATPRPSQTPTTTVSISLTEIERN
uniref:SelT-like protein n=1 Tax=Rhizophora mucronata TaxID=61149 RepID=A0A2P2QA24_RHIMU